MPDLSPEGPAYKTITLERAKVYAQGQVGAQVLHDMQAQSWVMDRMAGDLAIRLTTEVLRHKEHAEPISVPFDKTVHVREVHTLEHPRVWHGVAIAASIAGGFGAIAGLLWLLTMAFVAFMLLIAVLLDPREVELVADTTVSGTVAVEQQRWNSFPHNGMVYPSELGKPVRVTVLHDPIVRYDR